MLSFQIASESAASEAEARNFHDKAADIRANADRFKGTITEYREMVKPVIDEWLREPLKFDAVRDGRGGKKPKADLTNLCTYYQELLPIWTDAYKICRSSLASPSPILRENWREVIKAAYPTIHFPDDLFERLPPKQKWPKEVRELEKHTGGESDADALALLAAARRCNAAPKAYKVSTLKRKPGVSKVVQEFQK